jgi:outer membrane protein
MRRDRVRLVVGWLLFLAALESSFLLGAGVASAQGSADSLRLSLGEVTDRALTQGEEFKLSQADMSTARALYLQARATALPQVNGSLNYTRQIESVFRQEGGTKIEPFEPDTTASTEQRIRDLERALPLSGLAGLSSLFSSTSFGSKNTWVGSVGVSQKLFQGGSIWGSIAAARHAMSAARSSQMDKREEVVLNVREAYLGALLADRRLRIAKLALEQADSQLERVRLRKEAGESSEFVLLQAEVERDNQIPQVKRAAQGREVAYLELCRLANLPATAGIVLTSALLSDAAIPVNPAAVDTTGLVAQALRASGVEALEEALRAREHAVTVAKADLWPDLSLFANYSRQAFPTDAFPKSGEWKKDINAGARVTWNFFDGFRTKGAIQQTKAQASVARQSLNQTRELVREATIQSQLELERSASDLHARARTVQVARRAYELARLRYDEGASSLMEVNDARIAFQIAQVNEAEARHDYFVTLARLERFSGRPLFTSVADAGDGAR